MEEKFLMRSTNKRFISALACASAMTALAIADPMGVTKTHQVVQAATDKDLQVWMLQAGKVLI